ncbi:glycoprotein 6-alpha-L-fucosyltransferase [Entomortierella parvispora]|uniref:Glycoprotein 6-alpha-L-fucosyltransferase n=1 Tax=Entomortierella parvispora TaxID=205924 RepID=A0A9P3HE15_9FUNG|nr:glycoprotein 6-alpha-L-fucosyltransferase [Entomortierella parvispora]
MSDHGHTMVLEGDNYGAELDSFVQKKSHWMIDAFGVKGYERLTTYTDRDRASIQHDLDQLQNRCERFFSGAVNPNGFGSNWHSLSLGLALGLYHDMTLLTPEQPKNFINMTTCTSEIMESVFVAHPPETNYTLWDSSTVNFRSPGWDVWDIMTNKTIIKDRYHSKGLFWWRSMLTYYVTRPNAQMRQLIRESPKFPTPCIAIHVRHSDKRKEAELLDLPAYMEKAKKYKAKTGISDIYLMTDDENVIQSTKDFPDFKFHYRDVPRTNQGWVADMEAGITKEQQEINFILDVQSAAHCQKFIVTYSSNVGRLIAELAYALQDQEPDVDSLDSEWEVNP